MGKSAEYWVGFDLGGTKMLATVFDDNFEILGRERKKTKGFEGQEATTGRIVRAIQQAIKNAPRIQQVSNAARVSIDIRI